MPAFEAALRRGYAIETDLRAAFGGEPFVFHDEVLERLTALSGPVAAQPPEVLRRTPLAGTATHIPPLAALLDLVRGRVPLFLEVKSGWPSEAAFLERIARLVRPYRGPVAMMSFDPAVLAAFRALLPGVPRGLGCALAHTLHANAAVRPCLASAEALRIARPHFLAVEKAFFARMTQPERRDHPRLPVAAWTVTARREQRALLRYADAIIFEGFHPDGAARM